jgi:hypothetical protein
MRSGGVVLALLGCDGDRTRRQNSMIPELWLAA